MPVQKGLHVVFWQKQEKCQQENGEQSNKKKIRRDIDPIEE
jgi:hypothetical protein